jgi:hypothetical protein
MVMLDLAPLTDHGQITVISGKDRGEQARTRFELDRLDASAETVDVYFPATVISVTPSFVQGMFSKSVWRYRSVDAFTTKYRFHVSPVIMDQVRQGAQLSLLKRHALSGIKPAR